MGAVLARKWLPADGPGPSRPDSEAASTPFRSLSTLVTDAARKPFPDYHWQRIEPNGTAQIRSIADHAGRLVVLNVWATWCEPCGLEMPSLARLAVAMRDKIDVLPVSIDRSGAQAVHAFFASHRIEGLPVLIDPSSAAMTTLGLTGLPTTFLIGGDGSLRARLEGAADWSSPEALAVLGRLTGS